MRISKYKPILGVGVDAHGKMAPTYLPPVPPLPPGPLMPTSAWAVVIAAPWGALLTGKWSQESVATEGMGDILWQYDWGPGQVHIPILPPYLTPSLALLLLSSSVKYWMPSFMVQEKINGGAMYKLSGGGSPVAISAASFFISTQDCEDIACAVSYVGPTSISFQHVSTRWVAFNGGDFFAGLIGMAGDALSAAVLSYFGGKLMKGVWDNMLFGALANTFLSFLVGTIPYLALGSAGSLLVGFYRFMMSPAGSTKGYVGIGLFAGFISWASGALATAVGTEFGSKPPGPPVATSTPTPAGSAPPDAGTPTTVASSTPPQDPGGGGNAPFGPPAPQNQGTPASVATSSPPPDDPNGAVCVPPAQSGQGTTPGPAGNSGTPGSGTNAD